MHRKAVNLIFILGSFLFFFLTLVSKAEPDNLNQPWVDTTDLFVSTALKVLKHCLVLSPKPRGLGSFVS